MVLFGIVAFFQITFLPGFILLKFLRLKDLNWLQSIIYSFGLSLLVNYLMVYHLALIGIYRQPAVYLILVLEFICLLYLAVRKDISLEPDGKYIVPSDYRVFPKNIMPVFSIIAILSFLYFFFSNLGSVFDNWDPVFSWNRWAIDWYLGDMPFLTNLYPQLIPANWSISYMMMGTHEVQMVAKSIMPLFSVFILLIFFSLYQKKKNQTYLVALIFYCVIILVYSLRYISTGYVDIAVSFFSILTLYAILDLENSEFNFKKIVLVFLFSSAAALTKQAGFIILIFALIWISSLIVKNRIKISKKKIFMTTGTLILLILFNLYWYILKIIDISRGMDFSTLKFLLSDIHHDANYFQRFTNGLNTLKGSSILFIILVLLSLISIFNRRARWFTIGLTIPSIIIWGFYFSYDDRNIIYVYPFLAFSISYAISFLYDLSVGKILKRPGLIKHRSVGTQKILKIPINKRKIFTTSFLVILALIFLTIPFSDRIILRQAEAQKQIGMPSINKALYDYKDRYGVEGIIITDYYWITAMPRFEGSSIKVFHENDRFIIMSNSDSYELINPITLAGDNTFGFLISEMYYRHPEFYKDFQEKIGSGRYSLIFEKQDYFFIKIN